MQAKVFANLVRSTKGNVEPKAKRENFKWVLEMEDPLNGVKPCPSCRRLIHKNSGCMHMKCKKEEARSGGGSAFRDR